MLNTQDAFILSAMRMSKQFGRTLREAPADAETISHQLLVRAGFIDQLSAGVYSYLPSGLKVKKNLASIDEDTFAILLQYPTSSGSIEDYSRIVEQAHSNGSLVIVATDLLSLCLLKPPGEWLSLIHI